MSTVVVVRIVWPAFFTAEDAEAQTLERMAKLFNPEMFEIEDVETDDGP